MKYADFNMCSTGGTGVIAFELRKQYPEMDVTVFEMKTVVELAKEKFIHGNEHLGVKWMIGKEMIMKKFLHCETFLVTRLLCTKCPFHPWLLFIFLACSMLQGILIKPPFQRWTSSSFLECLET